MEVKDLPSSSMVPSFARGLNILLVDYDTTSLMYIASMLEQYSYKVTTTELASVALSLIRQEKDRFKLVIANVDMPDVDRLSFLRVLLKKEIPIMLMASQRNLSVAAKALSEGACFFLEKPIAFDDLKHIWQHVYKTRQGNLLKGTPKADREMVNHGKAFQGIKMKEQGGILSMTPTGNDLQYSTNNQDSVRDRKGKNKQIMEVDVGQVVLDIVDENSVEESRYTCTEQLMTTRENRKQGEIVPKIRSLSDNQEGKREEKRRKLDSDDQRINYESKEPFEKMLVGMIEKEMNGNDGSFGKKRSQRLSWTSELHHKFTAAISALGDRKARPKLILKMMNVPHLTQRQVASHLQKYKTQIRSAENATADLPLASKPLSFHDTSTKSLQTLEKIKSSTSQAGRKSSHNIAIGGQSLGADTAAGGCTSGSSGNYVPNKDNSPSDFIDRLAPKTAALSAPPRRSVNRNQPSVEYAHDHLLKLLDEGEEELKVLACGLNPSDVDRYYKWLTEALLEDSEHP